MLYVVARPLLSEADDTALRRLRAQYHPREAELIGPHFTLVFGAPVERESMLRDAVAAIDRRPFWFLIDRIARVDLHLYAERRYGGVADDELLMACPPDEFLRAIEGMGHLGKNGLRYPFPPYGAVMDPALGMAKSYS